MKIKIFNAIDAILKNNQQKLQIPLYQKAKFERWLQIELAAELNKSNPNTTIEYTYPNDRKKRADIFSGGFLIEIKTPNTNFQCSGISNKYKPFRKNVNSAINDIIRIQNSGQKGIVALVFFPVSNSNSLDISKIRHFFSSANIKEGMSCNLYYIFVAEV